MFLTSPSNFISTLFLQLSLLVFAKLNKGKMLLAFFSTANLLSVCVQVCEHNRVRWAGECRDTLDLLGVGELLRERIRAQLLKYMLISTAHAAGSDCLSLCSGWGSIYREHSS